MIAKARRHIVGTARDYRVAVAGFSPNARRFLVSGWLQGLGGGILATVFGIYIKTAGMSESVVGDVEASIALAAALVSLLGTPLIARIGYKRMMVAALALVLASRFGQALFPTAMALVGLALVIGMGDGFMRAIGSAFMSENSGHGERAHLFSTEFLTRVSAGFLGGLAGGMLPTLLGRFVPEVAAYQWTIVIGSALAGAGVLPMLGLKDRRRESRAIKSCYVDSVRGFTKWRLLGKLVVPQAAISLGGGMVIPFVPLYLKHGLGASIGEVGVILGFSSVVTAVGAFATPAISKRLGLPTAVAVLQGLSVPFLAAVSLASSLPMAIGALWIRGALMNMAGPMYNQLSMEGLTDREKPLVAGWMFFALNMMWLLGNLIGGRLMETSYTAPYVIAVGLYATGATLTYLFWRGERTIGTVEHLEVLPEAA